MTEVIAGPITAAPPDGAALAAAAMDQSFAELLRTYRERAGLTQRALADLSTVSPRAIRDLEAGRANARTQTIHLLADGLRLQGLVRELFVRAGLGGRRGAPFDGESTPAVPKPVNALLGRDTEVRAMADVFESGRRRMIAVSGLPGVGKTRVVAEIATRLSARRGWPVLWIGSHTSAVTGNGTVFGRLMRSLRALIESETDDVASVCQLVSRHEALVVLDGVADLKVPVGVEELLAYCPGVRVISTSRAPWHVSGVQAAVISPLPTPGPEWGAGRSLEALAAVASVRLLVDRLAEVRPGFTLNAGNADAVADLCRRLDGLPLALEVVAGRFRVLGLRQLADLPVADVLDFTVPAPAGANPTTIGGLIASIFERLDPGHRSLLCELARFDRAWTVPDVAATLGRPLDGVVDSLSVLIGFGLVRATHGDSATALHVPNLLQGFLRHRTANPATTPAPPTP